MKIPIVVLISDLHFNLQNLKIASAALRQAFNKASDLDIPVIIAGDLNDSKAIIRAEVANELLAIQSEYISVKTIVLVGNHDLINEKGHEHGLNYLANYWWIIQKPVCIPNGVTCIPYQSDSSKIAGFLDSIPKETIVIMHQGFKGAFMGDYIQDKSSLDPEVVKDYKVFSGHYHRHQAIGTVTYLGSPYTTSFGEANDPYKGFLVLFDDGTYERIPTNLRQHKIIEFDAKNLELVDLLDQVRPEDLVWVKVKGTYSELKALSKKQIGDHLFGHSNFKLEFIETESENITLPETYKMTNTELLDKLIDSCPELAEQNLYLKELYREIIKSIGS